MAVHRRLGPGHREDIYQRALEVELTEAGFAIEPQKNLEVYDEGRLIGLYIPDIIVENKVVVEIKAFAALPAKYLGQVIAYLDHTGLQVGLLINLGERSLHPRRVFPSPAATEFRVNHQWLFVPDGLKPNSAKG
jgi:GxxExxY protein